MGWRNRALVLAWFSSLPGPAAPAQTATALRLPPLPEGRLPATFTTVSGIHELSDGRVIILDRGDRTVHLADFRTGTVVQVGRHGSGPGEYLLPTRLLPGRLGAVAVHDPPNARLLLLDPRGVPVGTVPDRPPRGMVANTVESPAASGADTAGHFYARAQSAAPGPGGRWVVADSAAILRWSAEAPARDTMAFIPTPLPPGTVVLHGMVVGRPWRVEPFTVVPTWAVGPDGRVGVVHPNPWRVELIRPDGTRVSAVPDPGAPIRVTEGHRRAWRAERGRPVHQTVYPAGGGTPFIRIVTPRVEEPARWPTVLPPLTAEPPRFDDRDFLWVERSVAAGAPRRYDVFDPSARRLASVELPAGTRLLGFGRGVIYVARRDPDALERLEKFRMPGTLR